MKKWNDLDPHTKEISLILSGLASAALHTWGLGTIFYFINVGWFFVPMFITSILTFIILTNFIANKIVEWGWMS